MIEYIDRLSAASVSTINKERLEYFEGIVSDWWNPHFFPAVHLLIPTRREFIIKKLNEKKMINLPDNPDGRVLKGLKVLDAGCGVGIITEELAKLGANTTGIDPSQIIIEGAKYHLTVMSKDLVPNVTYITTTAEDHVIDNAGIYDLVVVFFVIENLDHWQQFLTDCHTFLKPGGSLILQTMNKNLRNICWFLYHIYVTQIAPRNVAAVSKVPPRNEVINHLLQLGFKSPSVHGGSYTLDGKGVRWTESNPSFYSIHVTK